MLKSPGYTLSRFERSLNILSLMINVSIQDQFKVKQADNPCPNLITADMSVKRWYPESLDSHYCAVGLFPAD